MSEEPGEYDTGRPKLRRCPCGKTPSELMVNLQGSRGQVYGDCCGIWSVPGNVGTTSSLKEFTERATHAWNEAPRALPGEN